MMVLHIYIVQMSRQINKCNDLEILKLQQGSKKRKIAQIIVENSHRARSFDSTYARKLVNELFYGVLK